MKNSKIGCMFLLLLFVSCSTMQKFVVTGIPGTEIYSSEYNKLGTIGNDGKTELHISSDSGDEYLLTKSPGDNRWIPFALDYKYHPYLGDRICLWSGYALSGVGTFVEAVGLIALLAGDEDTGAAFCVPGALAMLAGVGISMPANCRLNQTAEDWNFKYLKDQVTNQDIVFTNIVDNGFKRSPGSNVLKDMNNNSTPAVSISPKSPSGNRQHAGTASSRTFSNHGKAVSGVYEGMGKLSQNGKVVDNYSSIRVEIKAIDKETVSIAVIEGGESFFYSEMNYSVQKEGQGYVLTSKDIQDAKITIDSHYTLSYIHPSVSIDNMLYTLALTCHKK